jgi:hypothetical protein
MSILRARFGSVLSTVAAVGNPHTPQLRVTTRIDEMTGKMDSRGSATMLAMASSIGSTFVDLVANW